MKGRDWSTIAYEDKYTIETIIDIIEEIGLQVAISPRHDKDIYTKEDYEKWEKKNGEKPEWKIGDYKKAHYHILIHFNGPTTYNNVKELCEKIGATIPKKVYSNNGYFNYLCHIGLKEKAQYDPKDIKLLNGYEITLTENEEIQLAQDIIGDIQKNEFKEYREVVDYYMEIGDVDRFSVIKKQVNFFKTYINSKRWSKEEKEEEKR